MEDAQSQSSFTGSDDRYGSISETFAEHFHEDDDDSETVEVMKFPWSSPSLSTSSSRAEVQTVPLSPGKANAYKKSLSSNILSRFNIMRNAEDERSAPAADHDNDGEGPRPRKSTDDDGEPSSPVSPIKVEHALTAALKPTKTRKRKGSLRKTALLGGKRLGNEGRERKNSLLQRSPSSKQSSAQVVHLPGSVSTNPVSYNANLQSAGENRETSRVHRRFGHEGPGPSNSSSDNSWTESAALSTTKLSLVTDHQAQQGLRNGSNDLGSPLDLKSATSQTSYASTTDDDDILTFDRPASGYVGQQRDGMLLKPHPSPTVGYFPPVASVSGISRRRSSKQSRSSPLSHSITALSSYPDPEPHDYTETEYWGWVILFITWLTFAVGMGSCLEIWSWAWDVGETPYAPPELEDDPTLPIVGYYPALIVLTGVVAWVWITVAWTGMKYFRHAKIEV